MKASKLGYALSVSAAALLAGCGVLRQAQDDTPPVGATGAMPQSRTFAIDANDERIKPDARGRELLYVTGYPSTNFYTYPRGKFVSTIQMNGFSMCSDSAGHVFIANYSGVYEYPHGSATQIAFLPGPFGSVHSCSVDPTTGDLAVASASTSGDGIGVYRPERHHHWHVPRVYRLTQYPVACSYDSMGNLFVDAVLSDVTHLFELPKGGAAFQELTLSRKIVIPGYLQWDGQYLAIADKEFLVIYRFAIKGRRAKQIGILATSGALWQFWIQGNILIGVDGYNQEFGFWHYPQGGSPFKTIKMSSSPLGATVSLAPIEQFGSLRS